MSTYWKNIQTWIDTKMDWYKFSPVNIQGCELYKNKNKIKKHLARVTSHKVGSLIRVGPLDPEDFSIRQIRFWNIGRSFPWGKKDLGISVICQAWINWIRLIGWADKLWWPPLHQHLLRLDSKSLSITFMHHHASYTFFFSGVSASGKMPYNGKTNTERWTVGQEREMEGQRAD